MSKRFICVALLVASVPSAWAEGQAAKPKKLDLPMPPPPAAAKKSPTAKTAPAPAAALPPAARPVSDQPVKMAAPQLSAFNLGEEAASFYSEHIAQQLQFEGIRVTTAKQITTLLNLERQKEMLSCNESSSCLAELANALGVDCILSGDLGKFGERYQINLKVISSVDGRTLTVYSGRVRGEEELLDELSRGAKALAAEVAQKLGRTLHREYKEEKGGGLRSFAWIPAAAAAAALGGGGYFLTQSESRYSQLTRPHSALTLADGERLRQQGASFQTMSTVGFGVGAALLMTSGAMFIFGGSGDSP